MLQKLSPNTKLTLRPGLRILLPVQIHEKSELYPSANSIFMRKLIQKYPFISLLWLALVCGGLWRWEVEYHGWRGLIWVSYFHYAIPIGFGLFLLWANALIEAGWSKRVALNLLVIIYAFFLYKYIYISIYINYNSGPSAFAMVMTFSRRELLFYGRLILFLIPFMPIGISLILRLFRFRQRILYVITSLVGMLISVPLTGLILRLIDHKGGNDPLHALKSGLLAVFWVFFMGFLLFGIKKGLHKNPNPQKLLSWIQNLARKKTPN